MTYPSSQKTVLIGKETSWGTAVSATKDIGLVQDASDNISREIKESMALGSVEAQKITTGIVDVGFSTTAEFQHGRLFEYLCGTVTHTNSSTDFRHTFAVAAAAPSATIESGENGSTDNALIMDGMLAEAGELSIALNEVLKLKVDWKGRSVLPTSTTSAAVIDTLPTFPHAQVDINIDGTAATEVQNFSMKINKKVERSGGISSNVYQQGHPTELRCEFSGQLGFDDKTYTDLFVSGTTSSTLASTTDPRSYEVEIDADNGTAYGSGQRACKLTFSNCHMKTLDKAASVGNLIFVDIAGSGKFSTAITVDDINGTTTW